MPPFNAPVADWLPKRLGLALSDVATLKKQGTEYIVNAALECVAIIGNMEHAPIAGGLTEATGLVGWGIAVRVGSTWANLGAVAEVVEAPITSNHGSVTLTWAASTDSEVLSIEHGLPSAPSAVVVSYGGTPSVGQLVTAWASSFGPTTFSAGAHASAPATGSVVNGLQWVAYV